MTNYPEVPNTKGAVFVLEGGPGNKPKFLIGQDARGRVGAASGGGVGAESLFSFGEAIATRLTSNQERVTSQIAVTAGIRSALEDLSQRPNCIPSFIILNGCTPQDASKFSKGWIDLDAASTGFGQSADRLDGVTGENADQMDQYDYSALASIPIRQVSHAIKSGTVTTAALNKILLLNQQNCNNCGDLEFLAVGDGISPATIPRIYYGRAPRGAELESITWVQQTIAAVANGAAESVAVAGNRVIVVASGTNGGIYTASLDDVKTGTAVFTLANGITASHVYNDIVALDGMTLLAVGAAGRIAVSTDGGFSFSLLTSPVATALNRVASGGGKGLAWITGASGVVLRVKNAATVEQITVTALGTDGGTAVAVPRNRLDEVYVGTDAGEIYRTRNARDTVTIWEQVQTPAFNIVEDIQFADIRGCTMFVVATNGASESLVYRDLSGGFGASWLMPVGTFATPSNSVINSIAPVNVNLAFTVGEPDGGQGFIGIISQAG